MEEIFRSIFLACREITWLKQISADEGQLESVDEEGRPKPVALLPCMLIDVQRTQWEAGDLTEQYGFATIVTRYAYRKVTDQSNLTRDEAFNASIEALKRRSEIESAIAALPSETSNGRLSRISTDREHRGDGIIVYRTTWGCSVFESLA